ncbi:MAG TPA: class I SAM-dependent methyltransferase [Pirellulales bacterium]|nr:class I SAM-dependent methyltransferase [Pirellulales bacterium]
MNEQHESTRLSYSSAEALESRAELFRLLKDYPGVEEETERSLGLFLRASLLARIFGIRELYEEIVMLPGIVVDLGTWRGQTAVLCENLRAIFEPLHFNRRIVCFDTFAGYRGFSEKDRPTDLHQDGTYDVGQGYAGLLERLLILHEQGNAMGHNYGKHRVIAGDCRTTVPQFFEQHPNEIVALAFFDLNCYEPTRTSLETVFQRLVPGGIIAFWQLTRDAIAAEGTVYANEVLNRHAHRLQRSRFYPGLCYLKKT